MYVALFLLDILALIGVLGSPIVLFVSFFLNDSPNANPALVGYLQLIFWLFPITAALGGVMGLVAARSRNIRQMAMWTVVAYSSPIGLILLLVLAFVSGI